MLHHTVRRLLLSAAAAAPLAWAGPAFAQDGPYVQMDLAARGKSPRCIRRASHPA